WPTAAGLWSDDGVSEPWRSQGRMIGRRVLVTFARKSDSPGRAKPKHQQKRGNSELTPEQPRQYCQSGINQAFPKPRRTFFVSKRTVDGISVSCRLPERKDAYRRNARSAYSTISFKSLIYKDFCNFKKLAQALR
ncbi:hypothetical protein ACSVIJ_06690, partial [Pseudomonas sp. NCHU5208]|uniref:hypothetical protein n=1 Tax=unclassified Pseudomonas TaxID=196821 RepID=UPI003F987D18